MKDVAFQEPEQIAARQNALLAEQLAYAAQHSPFYRSFLPDAETLRKEIRSVGDLHKLPFTTKRDLSERNKEFLCVPPEDIIEYVTTSGTLGAPVTLALTENDLTRLAYNEALSLETAGVSGKDIVQIMVTLDKRFMAGMAYYLGARRLGAAIIRSGVDSPAFQLDTIERMRPTTLIAVPSFINKLLDYAEQEGVSLRDSSVRKLICIGEPIRDATFALNPLAQRIAERWPLLLYSTYASSEMATAFTECAEGKGGHHQPELVVAELLDDMDQPVADGEPGELVITTLGVEAMPLVRFRTGDICRRFAEQCGCGRQSYRLGPVEGRKQQMIKYKGTTLYPTGLFDVLNSFTEISHYLVTLYSDALGLDAIRVSLASGHDPKLLKERLREQFLKRVRVVPELEIVPAEVILAKTDSPMARKAIRLIDERKTF